MNFEDWVYNNFKVYFRSGNECVTICVFHDDSSPSFYINVKSGKFYCQACQKGGSLEYLAKHLKVPYDSTPDLTTLLEKLNTNPETKYTILSEKTLNLYKIPTNYWSERGINEATCRKFDLGYSIMDDAATIPIRDNYGNLVFVLKRYLNNPLKRYEIPKEIKINQFLFGSWLITNEKKIAITEGAIDTLKCWQAGFPAVAIFGSSISLFQRKLLASFSPVVLVCLTDNDDAGELAFQQIKKSFKGSGILVKRPQYPNMAIKDPGEMTEQQLNTMYNSV